MLVNVGGEDAGVVAFDKATGKEAWKATRHGASYSSPVAATVDKTRHAIFFTREGLALLDPAKGRCGRRGAGGRATTPRSTPPCRCCWAATTCC